MRPRWVHNEIQACQITDETYQALHEIALDFGYFEPKLGRSTRREEMKKGFHSLLVKNRENLDEEDEPDLEKALTAYAELNALRS